MARRRDNRRERVDERVTRQPARLSLFPAISETSGLETVQSLVGARPVYTDPARRFKSRVTRLTRYSSEITNETNNFDRLDRNLSVCVCVRACVIPRRKSKGETKVSSSF